MVRITDCFTLRASCLYWSSLKYWTEKTSSTTPKKVVLMRMMEEQI